MHANIKNRLLSTLLCLSLFSCKPSAHQFGNSPNQVQNAGITAQREKTIQQKVSAIMDTLSLEQKVLQLMGEADQPKLARGEAISGYNIEGATTLPQQIGISCSWNPELLRINTGYTSRLMRSLGTTLALSPMLDVSRNAHWGRMEESFGESEYLTSRMGLAFVKGMQTDDLSKGVATTTKHFAGYGGKNDNLRVFYEEILMPHEVAIRLGNSQSLMPGYHSYQGVPAHASAFLLQDVLRNQWGYDGVVVSDYFAIKQIHNSYHYAKDTLEAVAMALKNGIHLELPNGDYYKQLPGALEKGMISMEDIDNAVRHILTLKGRLGLLDMPPVPQKNVELDPVDYRERAYISAAQSLVLLKNKGILPLSDDIKKIALVGPNADAVESLLGDYTHQTLSLYWGKQPLDGLNPKLITLLEGLQSKVNDQVEILYERGCDWTDSYNSSIASLNKNVGDEREKNVVEITSKDFGIPDPEKALQYAQESDVIIAAMGENRYLCGEGRNRSNIRLAGQQEAFVKELIAIGKPVVLIVFGGRPHVLTDIEKGCQAIVQAWYPGEEGGNAVADMLLGNINPSGKMTVTVPRSNKQCPIWYSKGYNPDDMPLYPFGHGLSYTTFTYSNLKVSNEASTTDQWIPLSFELENTGDRKGAEIAQLYVSAKGLSMPRPPIVLEGFSRVELEKGQRKTVTFYVSPQQLAFYDKDMKLVIEPGTYKFSIGASSTNMKLTASITVKGEKLTLDQQDIFFSETMIK
ncbi:glycoside hydrolase family 3 N-terminal domain-containing protein [Limibacter armeniacum]|uniref:glycoside hydrolase family 3 N-terminal domain-containing protein n=1 Tax=Limibacter armeniacum TaxID=466084 RepID=UPI002FE62CD8